MKKCFLLALCVFVSTFAKAYDFSVDGLYYSVIDQSGPFVSVVSGDVKYSGDLTIPNTVTYEGTTYTVTEMGSSAFYGCVGLASIVINDHIKTIPYYAFGDCTNLEEVTLGKRVEKFGMRAFINCTSLSSINLNDNIVAFEGGGTFAGCTSLTNVVIGSNVRKMEGSEFSGCTDLKTLEIHEGATVIGSESFEGCTALKQVDIPNSVQELGSSAFNGCTSLESVVIGDNVKTIPYYAFGGCTNLEKVTLGKRVEKFGMRAFINCTSLSSINLNDNIVAFEGGGTFADCTSLTKAVIGCNVRKMEGSEFSGCTNLKTLEIHEGATVIGDNSFNECTALQTVDIPNSVLKIGGSAFNGCSNLASVKIGDGVQEISYYVFGGCTRLEKVVIGAGMNSIGMRTFIDCNQLSSVTVMNPNVPSLVSDGFSSFGANLYVPSQSVNAYKTADYWKSFSNVMAIEDQIYLTIRQATEGSVKMLANIGERYSYDILPEVGWTIHSVTFNNEDVTGQLVGNNFLTPAMTSNGILSIVFVEESSAVRNASTREVRVTADNSGNIIINEAPYGETISIYSTNGTLLKQIPANGGRTSVNMNTRGIYIIKVGDMTAKLSL